MRSWRSFELLEDSARGLRRGWREAGEGRRTRWAKRFFGGWFLALIATLAITAAGARVFGASAPQWEREALITIQQSGLLSFSGAIWLDGIGNALILYPLLIGVAIHHARRCRSFEAIVLASALPMGQFLVLGGWLFWPRERPDIILGGSASPGGLFHSFPSGHLVQAIVAWGLLGWLWCRASESRTEKAAVAAVIGAVIALVAFGRLRLGAHWPSDLAASLIVGSLWVALAIRSLHSRSVENAPER
jgi:membrane-associated phospholipid phosphatase